VATEIEVARIDRKAYAVPETLGLSLNQGKRLTAAIQTEMVRAQASTMGGAFPMLRALRIALVQQGLQVRDLSIPVQRRAAQRSAVRRFPSASVASSRTVHLTFLAICSAPFDGDMALYSNCDPRISSIRPHIAGSAYQMGNAIVGYQPLIQGDSRHDGHAGSPFKITPA